VGPTLPGQALANKARANIGGFLLPGEGDRSVRGDMVGRLIRAGKRESEGQLEVHWSLSCSMYDTLHFKGTEHRQGFQMSMYTHSLSLYPLSLPLSETPSLTYLDERWRF